MRRRLLILGTCLLFNSIFANAQTTAGLDPSALFDKGMNALAGSSASRSGANAIEYFRRSAELGFAPAEVVLGYLYETGVNTTADPREALELYKKAAQQGDPLAQWLTGRMIYLGEASTRDLNEAGSWLEKSSSQNNPFAQYLLGKIAFERSHFDQSAELFRKAAEQGLPHAQLQLALQLRDGQGVPRDVFEAYVWMLVSHESGQRSTASDLQALEAELSSTQIEQAKSKARELEGSTDRNVMAHGCTGWRGEFDDIATPPPPDIQRFCR
jgi:TPR repeat protein